MRLVHFSHHGHMRFGVLLSDERVLDLTHFFRDESVLRSAGEAGLQTVREAVDRAHHRRSVGVRIYALDDIIIESPSTAADVEEPLTADESVSTPSELWAAHAETASVKSGFGIHLVRKVRDNRR
jgi:hypothetical protein